jgi:hypothetical protein
MSQREVLIAILAFFLGIIIGAGSHHIDPPPPRKQTPDDYDYL